MTDTTDLGMMDQFNWEDAEVAPSDLLGPHDVPLGNDGPDHEWPKQEIDPAKHTLTLEAKELANQITITVKLKGMRTHLVRQTLGFVFLRLAKAAMPFEVKVVRKDEEPENDLRALRYRHTMEADFAAGLSGPYSGSSKDPDAGKGT